LLEIQPQRDDARIELAFSYVLRQEGKEALESLAPVKRISPGLAPRLFEVMAYAHLAAGNRQEARSAARRWQETAGEDAKPRAEAMLRLIDAGSEFSVASPDVGVVGPEEPVSPERPALRRAPLAKDDLPPLPETGTTAGELVQVECASAELRLVVATADGERTFALEDPAKVTVVGVPGGVLELNCGAQSPRSVRLEYEPMKPPRAGVAGAVRILEFLPAAQKLP
jgi:hypothetical protein